MTAILSHPGRMKGGELKTMPFSGIYDGLVDPDFDDFDISEIAERLALGKSPVELWNVPIGDGTTSVVSAAGQYKLDAEKQRLLMDGYHQRLCDAQDRGELGKDFYEDEVAKVLWVCIREVPRIMDYLINNYPRWKYSDSAQ